MPNLQLITANEPETTNGLIRSIVSNGTNYTYVVNMNTMLDRIRRLFFGSARGFPRPVLNTEETKP